jgi:hypothetical protein
MDIIGIPKGFKYCEEMANIGFHTSPLASRSCRRTIENDLSICYDTFKNQIEVDNLNICIQELDKTYVVTA